MKYEKVEVFYFQVLSMIANIIINIHFSSLKSYIMHTKATIHYKT